MLVSWARHLSDFHGVYSNLIPNLSSFCSARTWHFLAGFLSRSDPVDVTSVIHLLMSVMLGTVVLENLQQNFV
jgi:hypothetical protein